MVAKKGKEEKWSIIIFMFPRYQKHYGINFMRDICFFFFIILKSFEQLLPYKVNMERKTYVKTLGAMEQSTRD